jgi:RimJ/RimL family protein N-acetyltransferase
VEIPSIRTPRLLLRGHEVSDFADCAAMWGDPEVTRFIGGHPSAPDEVWARILRYVGHWALLGYGYWIVREHDGRFVGEVGFADFKRDLKPSFGGRPEIGWALARSAHGKGFATEAVHAAIAFGDRHFAGTSTVCMISPENAPSLRVAAKCGYREYARTTYKSAPTLLFERAAAAADIS